MVTNLKKSASRAINIFASSSDSQQKKITEVSMKKKKRLNVGLKLIKNFETVEKNIATSVVYLLTSGFLITFRQV